MIILKALINNTIPPLTKRYINQFPLNKLETPEKILETPVVALLNTPIKPPYVSPV